MREHINRSMSRLSWKPALGGLAVAASLVGLVIGSRWLPLVWHVGVWAALLIAAVILQACGVVKLFGPVLFYDMVRLARRGRYMVLRMLYGGIILFVMFSFWLENVHRSYYNSTNYYAMLAMTFFSLFMVVQMITICVLTPAYVGGAIAEEKERRTLEFMLATDLRNREIVLSKLVARLANLTLIIITGLPILSLLQFLGGIDPELLLAGFLGTAVTMISLACFCIVCSVYFKKPRDAIACSYLGPIGYLAVGMVGFAVQQSPIAWVKVGLPLLGGMTGPSLSDAIDLLNTGHVWVSCFHIGMAFDQGRLQAELEQIVLGYTTFHEAVALLCIGWSVWRVRAIALKQAQETAGKPRRWLPRWFRYRPPVSDSPVLWKELHVERRRPTLFGTLLVGILVLLTVGSIIPIIYDMAYSFAHYRNYAPDFWDVLFRATLPCGFLLVLAVRPRTTRMIIVCALVTLFVSYVSVLFLRNYDYGYGYSLREIQQWSIMVSTIVACLILLGVSIRASSCISSERDKNTLDFLLTTPLEGDTILWAKFLGCLYSLRLPLVWLGTIWWLALWLEGMNVLDVALQFLALLIYACAFIQIGMWFSMVCRNSTRATVATIFGILVICGAHWLPTFCCVISLNHPVGGGFDDLAMFQGGLTPPFVLGALPAMAINLREVYVRHDTEEIFAFCILGLGIYTVANLVFWFAVLAPRFRKLTNREERTLAPPGCDFWPSPGADLPGVRHNDLSNESNPGPGNAEK